MTSRDDMVERVAQVLWDEDEKVRASYAGVVGDDRYQAIPWPPVDEFDREEYRVKARAVIAVVTQS